MTTDGIEFDPETGEVHAEGFAPPPPDDGGQPELPDMPERDESQLMLFEGHRVEGAELAFSGNFALDLADPEHVEFLKALVLERPVKMTITVGQGMGSYTWDLSGSVKGRNHLSKQVRGGASITVNKTTIDVAGGVPER